MKKEKLEAKVKNVLQDAESLNVGRKKVNLEKLMDSNPSTYGKKGSNYRRALQVRWCNYKCADIKLYWKTLKKYDVKPSRKTRIEYEAFLHGTSESKAEEKLEKTGDFSSDSESESDSNSGSSSGSDLDSSSDKLSESDDESNKNYKDKATGFKLKREPREVSNVSSLFSNLKIRTSDKPMKAADDLVKSPPAKKVTIMETPFSAPPKIDTKMSSNASTASITESIDDTFEGLESNPFISQVHPDYPERNRDFIIQEVAAMERKDFGCPVVHISTFVPMLDYKSYTMRIPEDHEYPEYAGHCALLKRPSRDFYHRHPNLYEKGIKCDATNKAIDAREIAIQGDEETEGNPSRKWLY